MKKINKSFMMFTPLTLLGVASIAAVGTVLILNKGKTIKRKKFKSNQDNSQNENYSQNEDRLIEKESILNSLDKYFDNNSSIKQMSYSGNNSISSSLNDFLKTKAKEFINTAYQKTEVNFLEDLKLEIAKAGYSYDEVIQKAKKDIENISTKDKAQYVTSFRSSINGNDTYQKFADKLLSAANQIGIQAGIASAIAAAQWAAAFFSFGATIASATAATAQAAALAAEAITYRVQYDKLVSHRDWSYLKDIRLNNKNWNKVKYVKDIIVIAQGVVAALRVSNALIKTIVAATSWASPVGSLVFALTDLVFSVSTFIIADHAIWNESNDSKEDTR